MKKKIRYSDFPSPPAASERAADVSPPASEASAARKPRAPVELARALAAARAAESAGANAPASQPAPPPPPARRTPVRASVVIPTPGRQLTPVRGTMAISTVGGHLTPLHGSVSTGASRGLRERARARTGPVELLLFRIGGELFGMELAGIEEAIDLPQIRHVPEMPPSMLGVITARGTLTPIYSPEHALGVTLASRGSALVFRRGARRVALIVDDVDDVFSLDLALLRDAPGIDASDGVLLGVIRRSDTLLAVVDAEALITACQAVPIMEIT
jgi:purine-binding chemotaxis protein CheW